jgi:anti-sigma regulatory factor (Ser/Thr protein kinase)
VTAQRAPEAIRQQDVGSLTEDMAHGAAPVGLLPDARTSPGGRSPGRAPGNGAGRPARLSDEVACALRGRPESVKLARDFARETLEAWGLQGLEDDVAWVISELVTNALNHGLEHAARGRWSRPIQVRLTMQLAHMLCMVSDPGSGIPVRKEPDHLRECGRGLQVVESCSDRWGWNPLDHGGKVLWAAFRVRG